MGHGNNSERAMRWNEARDILMAQRRPKTDREVQVWVSKVKARQSLLQYSDLIVEEDATRPFVVPVGSYGICRHRVLELRPVPRADEISDEMTFGDIYSVDDVSDDGGWLYVRGLDGRRGWCKALRHLAITMGEFKVLKGMSKTTALNFLVTVIHLGQV